MRIAGLEYWQRGLCSRIGFGFEKYMIPGVCFLMDKFGDRPYCAEDVTIISGRPRSDRGSHE
jgi:hypothetical protein